MRAAWDSVRDAVDEIVIVDTGSTDRTKEIARGYTEKVFDFEWIDDFPPPATMRTHRLPWITRCGWTPTMSCLPASGKNCCVSNRRCRTIRISSP